MACFTGRTQTFLDLFSPVFMRVFCDSAPVVRADRRHLSLGVPMFLLRRTTSVRQITKGKTMTTFQIWATTNDRNGNPRRVLVEMDGTVEMGAMDVGYLSEQQAIAEYLGHDYTGVEWRDYQRITVTPSEYKRALKYFGKSAA